MDQKISIREKIGYSLGDVASNLFFQTFLFYLMFFYTDVFGIPAAVAGTMFFVSRIWDTINDPSENYQYYWWIDTEHGGYYAEGDKCQFIYVYPKADLVLARFGTDCGGYVFGIHWIKIITQWLEGQLVEKQY